MDVTLLSSSVPLGIPGLTEPQISRLPPMPPFGSDPLPTFGVGGVAVAARTPYVGTYE